MTRNEARETLMQILYELDTAKYIEDGSAKTRGEELLPARITGDDTERCLTLLDSILTNLDEIDGDINSFSSKWKTTRMPKVDLAIMRLAIGEMKYTDDIPHAVIVNEAINIAKKYSTENSAKFIHGLLGTASKTYTGN